MFKFIKYVFFIFFISVPFYSSADIKIIDADTIKFNDKIIRLSGIDAPEKTQQCEDHNKIIYNCGIQAKNELIKLVSNNLNKKFHCDYNNKDRYNRFLGECYIGGININKWLVRNGWAIAYRKYSFKYIEDEHTAMINQKGIWSGKFLIPWKWRKGERLVTKSVSTKNRCNIKGNISSNGDKIYHIQGDLFYKKTKISPNKGEKWFCSEKQAIESGWRKSKK